MLVFSTRIPAFKFIGGLGVAAAVIQSGILLYALALSWWLLPVMFITSSVSFLFVTMLIKIFTGKENHVMLRYFIVIMLLNYCVIHWLGQPVFPYLDILALGYATIIFFGRFGCYMVGCCHGRPSSFGVCYTHEHIRKGFTDYYSGVRLFPVQLAEALGILVIICISIFVITAGFQKGMVLSVFVTLYGLLRFVLEFFRGDPDRPYFLSFSEAQWTILLLFAAVSLAGRTEIVTVADWQMITFGIFVLTFFSIGVARFVRPQFRINEPSHIKELMKFELSESTQPVKVHTTSLGINISGCVVNKEAQYTLSAHKFQLDNSTVHQLKKILSMRHGQCSSEMQLQRPGVFSLIFRSKPG